MSSLPSTSPWLSIPLADYERHMALPQVGQAAALASEFERLLREHRPAAVALLGCAGGNGLERVDPATTQRVVAPDLNPGYVAGAATACDLQLRSTRSLSMPNGKILLSQEYVAR
jgi:hypothetical protein